LPNSQELSRDSVVAKNATVGSDSKPEEKDVNIKVVVNLINRKN
jgi:hypothetical protein